MNREKQIEKMARDMCDRCREAVLTEDCQNTVCDGVRLHAEVLYAKGYRKIHDDDARQCVCYALGCQMAERLERKVALEVCTEIGERFKSLLEMLPAKGALTDAKTFIDAHWEFIEHSIVFAYDAELKKKYTEGGE